MVGRLPEILFRRQIGALFNFKLQKSANSRTTEAIYTDTPILLGSAKLAEGFPTLLVIRAIWN